jgi:hypothetical protein
MFSPRKPTRKEIKKLKSAVIRGLSVDEDKAQVLLSDAAIAIFDGYNSVYLQGEVPNHSGKLMVCVYPNYPKLIVAYIWRAGEIVELKLERSRAK